MFGFVPFFVSDNVPTYYTMSFDRNYRFGRSLTMQTPGIETRVTANLIRMLEVKGPTISSGGSTPQNAGQFLPISAILTQSSECSSTR